MQIIEPPEVKHTEYVPEIDWSLPVVAFDPWPFRDGEVPLTKAYYVSEGGEWNPPIPGLALFPGTDRVLAWATDGKPVVTSLAGIDALKSQ